MIPKQVCSDFNLATWLVERFPQFDSIERTKGGFFVYIDGKKYDARWHALQIVRDEPHPILWEPGQKPEWIQDY